MKNKEVIDFLYIKGVREASDAYLVSAVAGMTYPSAAQLLGDISHLHGLRNASMREIRKQAVLGLGRVAAARIAAAIELGRRASLATESNEKPLRSAQDVFNRMRPLVAGLEREVIFVLGVNNKNRVVVEHKAAEGTLHECLIEPRGIFVPLLRSTAANAILVHNHTSGDPSPSTEDRLLTTRMCEAGRLLGIKVLDHVIVGTSSYYSFRDDGVIA